MNKYTLITGASGGIGLELARIAWREKRNLVLVARDKVGLEKVRKELEQSRSLHYGRDDKQNIEILAVDLTDENAAKKVFELCESKKIVVEELINNAGIGNYGQFSQSDFEKQNNIIHLNVRALTQLCHLFLPTMVKRNSGKIMNVGSIASFLPGPNMSTYYATKHFVLAFSEGLAEELSKTNVTVTCLCPGPTRSGFSKTAHAENSAAFSNSRLPTAKTVARYGWESMQKGKRVAIHGTKNKLFYFTSKLLPRRFTAKLVNKIQN